MAKSNNTKKQNKVKIKTKNNNKASKQYDILKKDNLTKKEINKKRYESKQKIYREKQKKEKEKNNIKISVEVPKSQIKKEKNIKKKDLKNVKVKKEKKESQLKKNIKEFKSIGTDAYKVVKEKTSDKSIPLGKDKKDKKRRKNRYFKESIVFAIIITIINLLSYVIFDYVNLLRISDIKVFNVIATMITSLIISYIFSFIIDYIISELWVIIKRKHTGDINGNKVSIETEYQENIENKK